MKLLSYCFTALLACLSYIQYSESVTSSCADNTFHLNFTSTTMVPDPPVQGSTAFVNASGIVNEMVSNGTISMYVLLDGVQLYTNNANTCGQTVISLPLGFGTITINSLTCPTKPNTQQNISIGVLVPSGIPSGTYTVIFNATDQNNNNLYCLNATFNE